MSVNRKTILFGLGLGVGIVGALAARRLAPPQHALTMHLWQRSLAERGDEQEAARLVQRVRARYRELLADAPAYVEPALNTHLRENILPGLALYQVLRAERRDRGVALAEAERLFRASTAPRLLPMRLLRLLPEPFPFFRWANRQLLARQFPAAGWDFRWVEDSPDRLAYNAHRCFYLNTLSAYGAPELTPLFCKTDDWMMEHLPPSIVWQRRKTLGRGDDLCDFGWCRAVHGIHTDVVG